MECIENTPGNSNRYPLVFKNPLSVLLILGCRRTRKVKSKGKVAYHLEEAPRPSRSQSSLSGFPSPVSLDRAEHGFEERPSTYPLVNHVNPNYSTQLTVIFLFTPLDVREI